VSGVRILHVSDTHIEPEPEVELPGSWQWLQTDLQWLRRIGADFAVVSGDLTDRGSSRPADFRLAREWCEALEIPYAALPGNHDLGANAQRATVNPEREFFDERPFAETGFAGEFGTDPVTATNLGPLTVVTVGLREHDAGDILPLLEQTIAACAGPVLLFGHYPIVPPRPDRISHEFGSPGYLPTAAPALCELVDRCPAVFAYGCGHVHVNSVRTTPGDVVQLTAGALGPGASSYRIYDIDGDEMHYSTALGCGPSTSWPDYLRGHDAPADFLLGTGPERSGTVPLSRG
jgi:hypothetical protein